MASTTVSIKYRPTRIGFLVRDGFPEDIVKAAGYNTLLWGGIFNPVIPVSQTNMAFAEQLIKLFSVDILFAVESTPEIQTLIGKYPFLRDPGHYAEAIFHESWRSKKRVPAFLDSKNIVDYFWQKEFKHKTPEFKSNFCLLKWQEADPLSKLFSIQFGYFSKFAGVDLKYDYEQIFLKGLRANVKDISIGAALDINSPKEYSPIKTTEAELTGYGGSGVRFNGDGIYVGKSDNFNDLLCFWNLRASGLDIVFFAEDFSQRTIAHAQTHLAELDKLPDSKFTVENMLVIYHSSISNEAMVEIIKQFQTKKPLSMHTVNEHSWNGLNIQPSSFIFGWEQVPAEVNKIYDRFNVNIRLPEKKFLVDMDDDVKWQYLAVTVDSFSNFGLDGHTLKPPFIRELNEFYSREIAVDPWAIRIEEDGVAYIAKVNDNSINLYALSNQSLIEKIFEIKGIKAKKSRPGLLADKIIDKLDDLEGGRVLKLKGVRQLLRGKKAQVNFVTIENQTTRAIKYVKADFINRGDALKTVGIAGFEKHKKLYIEQRDAPDLSPDMVFNFLLKKDCFRAGLDIECDQCKLKNWLSLKMLDDIWACEYCGAENRTNVQLSKYGEWKFRKSGLFGKNNNQEGSISVILTLLTLNRILGMSELTYSTALKLDGDDIDCEVDFSVMHHRFHELEFGFGECKSDGGIITQDDCDKLLKVYNKLKAGYKMHCYIIFSKTDDAFTAEEIERFKVLNELGVPLVLFTNRELEPYHPYWEKDDKDIPQKYANCLEELHFNSVARYLG